MKAQNDANNTKGVGKYQDKDASFLRRKPVDSSSAGYPSRDIWNDADAQSDRTGPVKLRKQDRDSK
jgi:hypothetical protein